MLEAAAVPVLLKAVDWIFGEGSKILDERRERRKIQADSTSMDASEKEELSAPVLPIEAIVSKKDALAANVSAAALKDAEKHIEHLLTLLEIQSRNYRLAKEKYAQWGAALVPPIVVNELVHSENEIAETTRNLQSAVSGVFGKQVTTPEIEAL